jgi:hypothetical protein
LLAMKLNTVAVALLFAKLQHGNEDLLPKLQVAKQLLANRRVQECSSIKTLLVRGWVSP